MADWQLSGAAQKIQDAAQYEWQGQLLWQRGGWKLLQFAKKTRSFTAVISKHETRPERRSSSTLNCSTIANAYISRWIIKRRWTTRQRECRLV